MGAVYIQLNNSFIKRAITHDYTDLSSSLGVSDKDLCTNSQTVFTGKFPSATQATREGLIDILSTIQKIGFAVPYFIIEPLALALNFLTLHFMETREANSQTER